MLHLINIYCLIHSINYSRVGPLDYMLPVFSLYILSYISINKCLHSYNQTNYCTGHGKKSSEVVFFLTHTFISMALNIFFQIKIVNIRSDEIVDGNPKLTLGLIWTIILHFQVSLSIVFVLFRIPFTHLDCFTFLVFSSFFFFKVLYIYLTLLMYPLCPSTYRLLCNCSPNPSFFPFF